MKLSTIIGVMAATCFLSSLPLTCLAQSEGSTPAITKGGWVVHEKQPGHQNPQIRAGHQEGEDAFLRGEFPELKGLTFSQEDQLKAFDICAKYHGDQGRICGEAAGFYMKQGQRVADAKQQSEMAAAQQKREEYELQQREAAAQRAIAVAKQATITSAVSAAEQADTAPAQPSASISESNGPATGAPHSSSTYAEAREQQPIGRQAQAAGRPTINQQTPSTQSATQSRKQQSGFDVSGTLWTVGILGFIVANIILFIGAAKKSFVVFYDKLDVIHTVLIFISIVLGYALAWVVGHNFVHTIFIVLGWVFATWFSVVTLSSSIKHNRSIGVGIFVGLMKIYTVVLIAVIAGLSLSLLMSTTGELPKNMDIREKLEIVRQRKRSGAMWAALAAGAVYLLVNGERVYKERGQAAAS